MYTSVTPIEISLNGDDNEIVLDDRDILQMEVKNKGTATLTLFTNTLLEQDDCWSSPTNQGNMPFSGRVKIKWGSTGTKEAFVYALVGIKS